MEENKIEKENIEELDLSRDQAAIVSIIRIQALENLLIEKEIIKADDLVKHFNSVNSKFVNSLKEFADKLEKEKAKE